MSGHAFLPVLLSYEHPAKPGAVEPVEKPVIANQSAFLVWQSPNFSGPKLIGSTLKLGDSHASVRYFLGMTLTFLTH